MNQPLSPPDIEAQTPKLYLDQQQLDDALTQFGVHTDPEARGWLANYLGKLVRERQAAGRPVPSETAHLALLANARARDQARMDRISQEARNQPVPMEEEEWEEPKDVTNWQPGEKEARLREWAEQRPLEAMRVLRKQYQRRRRRRVRVKKTTKLA